MPQSNKRKSLVRANVVKAFEDRVAMAVERAVENDFHTLDDVLRDVARRLGCTRAELKYYKKMIVQMLAGMGYS